MGPPLSTWPYTHSAVYDTKNRGRTSDMTKKCIMNSYVDNFRVICINFTFMLLVVQILFVLGSARAGPVVLNMDYMQGPVPLARNIRHLPCVSRRTSQEGLCMFAIDCLKANGSHLGTCIDRFYFGSCCQIPDKTILPQIIGNNIDDNSIDSANFVHPQMEDKDHNLNKIPDIFPPKKEVTTEKPIVETTVTEKLTTVQDRTESIELETKSDDKTTIDNNILNDDTKLTTAVLVETTTKAEEVRTTETVTEIPVKLSTFQTVSGVNLVTEKPTIETTINMDQTTETIKLTTETTTTSSTTPKPKPTRRPVRPTFTRPTYKPYNYTRPTYTQSTFKPKPVKPVTTRKPPYRNPPKRPTRKPLPSPPRLNITILPQSTSSKPIFTRPSVPSITYINTTNAVEEKQSTTTTTTTTTTTLTTTTTTTTTTEAPTEKVTETEVTEPPTLMTEVVTEKLTTTSEAQTTETIPETPKETTEPEATEKMTEKPVTEAVTSPPTSTSPVTSLTEYPPLVTWTSAVDAATKAPEKVTEAAEDTWSPITPPEGWVLISTISPKPEPSTEAATSTTTASTTTTTTTTAQPTTIEITQPYVPETTQVLTTEKSTTTTTTTTTTTPKPTTSPSTTEQTKQPTTQSSTTEKITTSSPTTTTTQAATEKIPTSSQADTLEFTVNVTLSPTVPTSTSSMGLTTFSSVSSVNATESLANETAEGNATTESSHTGNEYELESVTDVSTTETVTEIIPEIKYNMSDYKDVCGRRLWHAPEARIVGGDKSSFGQWPWQISLRQYRTSTYLHKCGAALLNENWAITAAHCVEHVPPSELLVRLGEHDLAHENEPYGYAERRVQIVASHPHFDPATFEYDLALLRFYEPVKFQPNILPVCVPDDDDDYVGKTAYVTGWGRLFDDGPLPSVLQEVRVPVINNSACEGMYQAAGYNEHIPNIFICAGRTRGGADSCEGDSGGPMVVRRDRDDRFVLSGIISWGIGCAEPNQPGVYTRISEFKDWINQILQF